MKIIRKEQCAAELEFICNGCGSTLRAYDYELEYVGNGVFKYYCPVCEAKRCIGSYRLKPVVIENEEK